MDHDDEVIRLYRPPQECGDDRCDDRLLDFVYCVVIPGAIVLILLVLLIRIMCWKSTTCKCKKYSSLAQTNDIQLENYNSIRRASASLRHMSQNRETALMGSRSGSMTLDRSYKRGPRVRDSCHSAPGTLQRTRRNRYSDHPAPPPPPPYSTQSDDGFLGPDFLASEMNAQGLTVRYEDSSDNYSNGAQPLVHSRSFNE